MKLCKKTAIILLIALIATCVPACRPKDVKTISYDNIFVQNKTIYPYTWAENLAELESGISPYTDANGLLDSTYIAEYGLVILQKAVKTDDKTSYVYGFFSVEKNKIIIPVEYVEFSISHGLISLLTKDKKCILKTYTGDTVFGEDSGFVGENVYSCFSPISKEYIAVKAHGGIYYNVYGVDGKIITKADGSELRYPGHVAEIRAMDNLLVRTEIATKTSPKKITIFNLASREVAPLTTFIGTTLESNVNAFYLGNGKFYCYDMYKGDKNGYQYMTPDGSYIKATSWYYDATINNVKSLSLDVIFQTIINSYNSEEAGLTLDIDAYIKKGYSYVSVGYVRDSNKNAIYDQFIIDSDMKILLSMVSQLGTNVEYNADNESFRDVLLTYVGEIGFNSTSIGELMLYDKNGKVILRKEGIHTNVFYNNGIVTSKIAYKEKPDSTSYYYGAFSLTGEPLFDAYDRKYTMLTAFIGNFALAETINNNGVKSCILVDKQGIEHPINAVIPTTSSKQYIYKAGCYAVKGEVLSKTVYGVFGYDGTELITPRNEKLIIAKYGTDTVVVYTFNEGHWNLYLLK
ncbi:MAG: hypothetical protein RR357_03670 [Clostridia bacterium]